MPFVNNLLQILKARGDLSVALPSVPAKVWSWLCVVSERLALQSSEVSGVTLRCTWSLGGGQTPLPWGLGEGGSCSVSA